MKKTLSTIIFIILLFGTFLTQAMGADSSPIYVFSGQELDELLAPIALYPDPLLAVILPASTYPEEINNAEFVILFRFGFDVWVVLELLLVGCQSITESHFSPRNCRVCGGALPLLFVEITQAQFGYADSVGFERFPNELAAHSDSGIIISRLDMTNKICHRRFLPS